MIQENSLAKGVLFYSSIYISAILMVVAVQTGRCIFLLMIVLSFGLAGYLMYMTSYRQLSLQEAGEWFHTKLMSGLHRLGESVISVFAREDSPAALNANSQPVASNENSQPASK